MIDTEAMMVFLQKARDGLAAVVAATTLADAQAAAQGALDATANLVPGV